MLSEGLSKSERVRSESRISMLFNEGRRGGVGLVKYLWRVVASESAEGARAVSDSDEASVAVMFSVPKKAFKRAWKRNLIKRRMKESYRRRKSLLVAKAAAYGCRIDIAFICGGTTTESKTKTSGAKESKTKTPGATVTKRIPGSARATQTAIEIPDFKTIDDSIAKIVEQIAAKIS